MSGRNSATGWGNSRFHHLRFCACGHYAQQSAGGLKGGAGPRGAGASGVCPGGGFQASSWGLSFFKALLDLTTTVILNAGSSRLLARTADILEGWRALAFGPGSLGVATRTRTLALHSWAASASGSGWGDTALGA